MPTIRHVQQLIQHGGYAFSTDIQDTYLHIHIVKHHCHFLWFVSHICLISGRFYLLGWPQPPRVFTALTKPVLVLCCCKGFHIAIYLDDFLVLVHSKQAGKRACSFLCPLFVCLGLHINFSKPDLWLTQTFCFLGLHWDTVCMSVSLLPDKLADIQQVGLSLLHNKHLIVHMVMSFLGKANFCTNGHSQLWQLCWVIQSDMLTVYHSPAHLFSPVHFSHSSLHQLEWLSQLQQSPIPLQFPLCDVVIATDAMPTHWSFYFQGAGLPLSVGGSSSGTMCRAHIALQELQAIAMMLCRMAFAYLVRWLPCIWITALLRLICVIKLVHCLLFFPGWPARYWVWLISMVLLLFQHTFLPTSMWRPIICPEIGCFQTGIFSLKQSMCFLLHLFP